MNTNKERRRRAGVWIACAVLLLSSLAPLAQDPATFGLTAGDLAFEIRKGPRGMAMVSLRDTKLNQEFLSSNALPLFDVSFRKVGSKDEIHLIANEGWNQTTIAETRDGLELMWEKPSKLEGVSIKAVAQADPKANAIAWSLRVQNGNQSWGVWRVRFPQVSLADLGIHGALFFPRGPGEVQREVWARNFSYKGNYAGGWCSMQFVAAYAERENPTGLYMAIHDPFGGTKDIDLKSEPSSRTARVIFDIPAPDMGRAAKTFELEGQAVWQLFRGDWFDAATIYKQWVQSEARWWPKLGKDGREDSPRWMRELNAWAQSGGAPSDCVTNVAHFQEYLGMPVGFHWYNWHQIPFDNDYPHYFPPKTNFALGVAQLERAKVHVMPYINGRLWDSKDRGAQDFEYTSVALPATTKQSDGKPFLESYGSKETNGDPVRLAAMCPTTTVWQQTVSNLVLRLLNEQGTSAVYIDQIAAAPPTLCMDPAHAHPLGGGHWWNEGYWKLLENIRRAMPREKMITTECNGEPFIRWFDGYLTWHWQYDGQVPAFPAIYGGAIQMFGRAYRGGATKDLALRMKAAQELVFGEQIGWLGPEVAHGKEAEFFRKTVQVRQMFNRYFHAGEMARPPRLLDPVARVKADWQWSGEWPVSTDALLTGAWTLPGEHKLLFLFANVSETPVRSRVKLDSKVYGLPGKVSQKRGDARSDLLADAILPLSVEGRSVETFELSW